MVDFSTCFWYNTISFLWGVTRCGVAHLEWFGNTGGKYGTENEQDSKHFAGGVYAAEHDACNSFCGDAQRAVLKAQQPMAVGQRTFCGVFLWLGGYLGQHDRFRWGWLL